MTSLLEDLRRMYHLGGYTMDTPRTWIVQSVEVVLVMCSLD